MVRACRNAVAWKSMQQRRRTFSAARMRCSAACEISTALLFFFDAACAAECALALGGMEDLGCAAVVSRPGTCSAERRWGHSAGCAVAAVAALAAAAAAAAAAEQVLLHFVGCALRSSDLPSHRPGSLGRPPVRCTRRYNLGTRR